MLFPIAVPQQTDVQLSRRVAREPVLEVDRARHLVVGEALAREGADLGLERRGGLSSRCQLDRSLHGLAPLRVGNPEDADVGDRRPRPRSGHGREQLAVDPDLAALGLQAADERIDVLALP